MITVLLFCEIVSGGLTKIVVRITPVAPTESVTVMVSTYVPCSTELSTVTTPVDGFMVIPAGVAVSFAVAIEKTNGVVPPVKVNGFDERAVP